jgi:uncharacterized protein YbbC (DUF1343 family)
LEFKIAISKCIPFPPGKPVFINITAKRDQQVRNFINMKLKQISVKLTLLILFMTALIGCARSFSAGQETGNPRVVTGAERLLADEFFPLIENKRVGLVTNHTPRLPDGRHLADVLHQRPDAQLTVLFGPEHGIRGDADAHVADDIDPGTNLPVIFTLRKGTKANSRNVKGGRCFGL